MDAIEGYIAGFPEEVQKVLHEIRQHIKTLVPDAQETITYGIPTFKLKGKNLVHFGGFKDHTSFFPTASGIQAFTNELTRYKTSKGTIQFPVGEPLPLDLIAKIVRFRVNEVQTKLKKK